MIDEKTVAAILEEAGGSARAKKIADKLPAYLYGIPKTKKRTAAEKRMRKAKRKRARPKRKRAKKSRRRKR